MLFVAAADLKGAGGLRGPGLEKNAPAGQGVEHRRGNQRSAQRDALQARRRGVDIGGGGQRGLGAHRSSLVPPGDVSQGAKARAMAYAAGLWDGSCSRRRKLSSV